MCTSNSLIERANRLRNDIDNVMTQIHSAANGNRLVRERFLALLARKSTIIAEANSIINEVNQTHNLAASDPSKRAPYRMYLDLNNARTIAREVLKMTRSTSTQNISTQQVPPNPLAIPFSDPYWLDDEELPF